MDSVRSLLVGIVALALVAGVPGSARAAEDASALSAAASALDAEIGRLEGERLEADTRRRALEAENLRGADEIARRKAEPAGIARDLQLGELLASAQDRSRSLERLVTELRERDAMIAEKRRALIATCRRALSSSGIGAADRNARARLQRLESAAVVSLDAAQSAQSLRAPIGIAPAPALDPLAGPVELEERADRMSDDVTKLRREIDRLAKRIDVVDEQRRLREGAEAVQDDFFVESGVGRAARRLNIVMSKPEGSFTKAADQAAPTVATPGATGSTPPSTPIETTSSPSTMLRGVVDPATLGDLRRAEEGSDPEFTLKALRRAQGDLDVRARDLSRRETELRLRAAALRRSR